MLMFDTDMVSLRFQTSNTVYEIVSDMSTRQDALEERLSSLEDKLQGLQVSDCWKILKTRQSSSQIHLKERYKKERCRKEKFCKNSTKINDLSKEKPVGRHFWEVKKQCGIFIQFV